MTLKAQLEGLITLLKDFKHLDKNMRNQSRFLKTLGQSIKEGQK